MSATNTKTYTPVQIQKLFFILDREIPQQINGPMFQFKPYDYGPFDFEVYNSLDRLIERGLVFRQGDSTQKSRTYGLTHEGREAGTVTFDSSFDVEVKQYISKVAEFVSSVGFAQLVRAVYKQYPDMKVNSVFSK